MVTLSGFLAGVGIEYAATEYTQSIASVYGDVLAEYGTKIDTLPAEQQLLATKLAVCHRFGMECWERMGYPGAPIELSSRNDTVRFAAGRSELDGTACGKRLKKLFKALGSARGGGQGLNCGSCGCQEGGHPIASNR